MLRTAEAESSRGPSALNRLTSPLAGRRLSYLPITAGKGRGCGWVYFTPAEGRGLFELRHERCALTSAEYAVRSKRLCTSSPAYHHSQNSVCKLQIKPTGLFFKTRPLTEFLHHWYKCLVVLACDSLTYAL